MHPNRHFLAHFVVHMPLCLQDLFRVAHPLHSNWGCEGTVARRRLLCKGAGGG